jgi:hypothetical protein
MKYMLSFAGKAAFLIALFCAPLVSQIVLAQESTFFTLSNGAKSGELADGLGYEYGLSGNYTAKNVYVYKFSNESMDGISFVSLTFYKIRNYRPNHHITFRECGNSSDTASMFSYLENRQLIDLEYTFEFLGNLQKYKSLETSKNVGIYDSDTVIYKNTSIVNDGSEISATSYYKYVHDNWCLVGAIEAVAGDFNSDQLISEMDILKQNALRLLGVSDTSGSTDAGLPIHEPDQPVDSGNDFPVDETTGPDGYVDDGTDHFVPVEPDPWGETTSSDQDAPIDDINTIDPRQEGYELQDGPSGIAIAAGTLAAGGIAGLGAWLMMNQMGVGRREMLDAVADLARGRVPSDGFDDWKAKYEAMGWTYREENGVAVFDPPPGYGEQASAQPPEIGRHRDGETNADTGEVWSDEDGGWIGRNLYEQEKRRAGDIAAIEERNRQAVAEWDAETQALDSAIASSARDRAARAAAEEAARIRIGDKLSRLLEADGISTEAVERMRRERDTVGLEDLYERTLRSRMARTSAEAAAFNREAAIYRAGELASKALLAGSKATMMAVTGPAGYIPAIIGSGVLRSAEEGAAAYVRSDGDRRELGTALVSGFFAGAKDGVVGRFTGLPRTGNVTKVVLPAAADAGETYIRTGDIKATMTTGLMSAAGGAAGSRMDRFGSAVAREAGQAATGATMGAVNAAVNGGSIPDAMMDGMADAIGGRLGQHVGAGQTPMTRKEIAMDLEYKAKLADARGRIDAFDKAVASGDPARIKPALQDVLEHREAKVLLKGKDVDPGLKTSFSELTQEHRTRPVMDGTADALNRQTVSGPDGVEQPRFVIRDANGVERPVTGADFASGSGKPGEPGVDLDMYPKGTIIDKATGRPAKGADVDQAVSESCAKLGIDRRSQEVNVTGMKGTEDITMRPGETPEQFYARAGRERAVSAAEGTGAAEVGTHKLHAADDLHGDGLGSSALAEKTRGVMKDKGRLIDPLIAGDGKAQIPEVFRRMEPVKRTSAMDVLQQLADGSIPPGTANARFRQLTNMDIDQALPKIAGWSEGLGKWGSGSPGGAPLGPSFTGPGGASNLQQVAAAFIRNFDATKSTE